MLTCEFREISKNNFLQNTSGRLLLYKIQKIKLDNNERYENSNILKFF